MTGALPPLAPGAAMRWDVVRRALPEDPGDVLEVGCGQGAFAARLAQHARSMLALEPDARSFDIAERQLDGACEVRNCRVEALPSEHKFDTVCAFEVIEHLEDDSTALAAWAKRLRPGGTMLISAPAHSERMGAWDTMVGHHRRYDPHTIATMLSRAGLDEVRVQLYGYPAGPLLEAARNFIARRRLRNARVAAEVDERTASSGRQLQPASNLAGRLAGMLAMPLVLLQRAFPNRGIALVASARMPR